MNESSRKTASKLARTARVLGAFVVVGCGLADPGGAAKKQSFQQMGNGPPGEGGFTDGAGGASQAVSTGGAAHTGGTAESGGRSSLGGRDGSGGTTGSGGSLGEAGTVGEGGTRVGGEGGTFEAAGATSSGGMLATGGNAALGGSANASGESGRMVGMTEAHNVVRAAVSTEPPLQALTWSPTIAAYAQSWADTLAQTSCASPHHRDLQTLEAVGYGENLAAFGSSQGSSTAEDAVNGWAGEKACWTYGTIQGTEQCNVGCYENLKSDGCGHYTQIVWRDTAEVGCGVATCENQGLQEDIWICNYSPPGNYVGQDPY